MNLKDEIITFPKRWGKIPHPIYVVRCDDHCMVCELDKDFNLVEELSNIHWSVHTVRRWALEEAKKRGLRV